MKKLNLAFLPFLLLLVAGCASLGLQPAQTFTQKLAYAYGTHTAVMEATAAQIHAGALSSADGEAVLKLADDSKLVLDSAQTLSAAGDMAGANNKLAIALAALTAMQDYLNAHKVK